MPILIKKIKAVVLDNFTTNLSYFTSLPSEVQFEDYINLNGYIAYLQDFTQAETLTTLNKPLGFGLKNQFNLKTKPVQISSYEQFQERIYNQSNIFVRNKAINNVNTSSDFCIFKSPTFGVDGATKVQCNTVECVLTGYSFSNMLTAATSNCIGTGSTSCYKSTTWQTVILANNNVVYNGIFYTTTNLTGDIPSNASFLNSVAIAYDALAYSYTSNGANFTIDKPYGVTELEVNVCITVNLNIGVLTCPAGFSATPANDACEQINVTAATFNGSGATILVGNQNVAYANYGTYFYPMIQNDGALPVYYIGNANNLLDQSGGTTTALNVNNVSPFWGNPTDISTAGRLNNIGLSATSGQYVGFTYCFNIATPGTYYVGLAADNNSQMSLNGQLLVAFSGSVSDNFKKWSVFPVNLLSGKNIIEMTGENDIGTSSAFAAEIYNPISYATLTAATSTGATQANTIFSTAGFVGKTWEIGTDVGYSCPVATPNYSLDGCGDTYMCTQIITIPYTGICTTPCSATCTTICAQTFDSISANSTGVYIVDNTVSSLPFIFNFTGNTQSFSGNNATFKFEVYKFNPSANIFTVPPVYTSPVIPYSQFSNTSQLYQNIPINSLSLDGDYLIKGYYNAPVCTTFLGLLGKTIDTSVYNQSSSFQLYESDIDYYFVAINTADTPIFKQTSVINLPLNGTLPLYQQVIVVNDANPSGYTRTGSTFTLDGEYLGNVIVTLSGLTLAENIDYTLSGTVLTFIDTIHNGDVITFIFTKTSTLSIISENIDITTVVPSGATDGQGSDTYYYNTTTGKYEIYTQNQILNFSNLILSLNGITLLSNIDYYQSISDSNRIILNGYVMSGDLMTVVYYPLANVINGITQNNTIVGWAIQNIPQYNNGFFNIEYSNDPSFSAFTISSTVPYQPLVTNYTGNLILTGSAGSNYYYRIQNTKNYNSICGDVISSTAFSETVNVTLQSNAINSY